MFDQGIFLTRAFSRREGAFDLRMPDVERAWSQSLASRRPVRPGRFPIFR